MVCIINKLCASKTLLTMKLTTLLIVLATLQTIGNGYSQTMEVTLDFKNAPVVQIFQEIEKQSNLRFLYINDAVKDKTTTLNVKKTPVVSVLDKILPGLDMKYTVMENNLIVITPVSIASKQGIQVNGKVTSAATGESLPGVNVLEKGTMNGAVTDLNGNYSLVISSQDAVLLFSFIGFNQEEIAVGNQTTINMMLVESIEALEEVVVVGYGTLARRSLSVAVTKINPDEKQLSSKVSILESMMGKGAGLRISQNNAQPGGEQTIRLRGKEPLYVIDGVPFDGSEEPGNGGFKFDGVHRGPLNSLNPNDIESIEILKDAGASIYGINASGGVILITTKKGKAGKVNVSYNASHSFLKNARYLEPMKASEYMEAMNLFSYEKYLYARKMQPYGVTAPSGFPFPFSQVQIDTAGDGTNWLNHILQDGLIDNHNLSLNGGNENTKIFMSANYFNQEGTVKNAGIERFTGRLNLEQKLGKIFRFNTNLTFNRTDYNNSTAGDQSDGGPENWGAIQSAIRYLPIDPVKQSNGEYTQLSVVPNPVAILDLSDKTISNRFFGLASLEADIISQVLTFKLNAGVNNDIARRDFFVPKSVYFQNAYATRASISDNKKLNSTLEAYFTFRKSLLNILDMNIIAGAGQYQDNTWSSAMSFSGFNEAFGTNSAASGTMEAMTSSRWSEKSRSFFARTNVDILDKYVVTITFRGDGVDKFFPGNKYAYFPGLSAAWKIHNEGFMKNISAISDLKLRISYGLTGRNTIGQSAYSTYGVSVRSGQDGPQMIDFNDGQTKINPFYLSGLNYPNLRWEKTKLLNGGIDFGILENRITGTFDAYLRDIVDLLQNSAAAPLAYYNSFPVNGGIQRGFGYEISLTGNIIRNDKFSWIVSLNLSRDKEFWKKRFEGTTLAQYQKEDDPVRAWYYLETNGILQIGQEIPVSQPSKAALPGCPIYVDQNGDSLINYLDVKMKDRDPVVYFGFNTAITYGKFDLSAVFYGQAGHYKEVPQYAWTNSRDFTLGQTNAITQMSEEVWLSGNPGGTLPGWLYDEGSLGLPVGSDVNYSNASFLRCQDIILGYTLSTPSLSRYFKSLRVFFDIQNVFVITKYKGFDPEVDSYSANVSTGRAPGSYPNVRALTFGLNINF